MSMRTPTASARRLVALAATASLVLAGCATQYPGTAPSAPAAVTVPAATATAASTSAAPTASPPASANPPAPPTLTAAQKKEFGSCLSTVLRYWHRGRCATLVQKKLKGLGFYSGATTNSMGVAAINAVMNYQRSRGLPAAGVVTKDTWMAIALKRPVIPDVIPAKCLKKGVVLCVDQAHRKLRWIKDGQVVRTFKIRVGGFNVGAKTHEWRPFPTANGTWKVYDKNVDPPSETYGYGVMPYSTMFYPDMYVHYSADFARRGYSRSSHGCVNIASLTDAKWIFHKTPIGATVITYGLILPKNWR